MVSIDTLRLLMILVTLSSWICLVLALSAISNGRHELQDATWVYAITNGEVNVLFGEYYAGIRNIYIGEYLGEVINYKECVEDFNFCATCSRVSKSTAILLSLALICNTMSAVYCVISACYDDLEKRLTAFTASAALFSFGTLLMFYRCYRAFADESGFSTVEYGVGLRALFVGMVLLLASTLVAVGLWITVKSTSKSKMHRIYVTVV
jgi:hypothetical protein